MDTRRILPGFTTTHNPDLEKRFEEIDRFEIDHLSFFPTAFDLKRRERLYEMLQNSRIKEIPHVHIRHDFENWEFDFFIEKYNTKAFNIHPAPGLKKLKSGYRKYSHLMYIENLEAIDEIFMKALDLTSGICVDFSHWHDAAAFGWKGYENFEELVKNHPVGCSHVSAVKKNAYTDRFVLIGENGEDIIVEKEVYNCHRMENLEDMDYLVRFREYLPAMISIELENGFGEQLKVREYLENMLNG